MVGGVEDRPGHHRAVTGRGAGAATAGGGGGGERQVPGVLRPGPLFAGVMALDGTVLEANRLALEACGYTKDEVIGKKFWDCPWWNRSPELQRNDPRRHRAGGGRRVVPGRAALLTSPTAASGWWTSSCCPSRTTRAAVVFLAPTGTDITDRKRAEADRQMFVTLVENSTDFIGICDLKGRALLSSTERAHMVGSTASTRPAGRRPGLSSSRRIRARIMASPSVGGERPRRNRTGFGIQGGARPGGGREGASAADDAGLRDGSATVSSETSPSGGILETTCGKWRRARRKPIAAKTNSWRRSPTNSEPVGADERIQVIQLAGSDTAAVGQAREMMERQMRHMVRLVDDLLDVSRITRGKLELRKQRVDLAAVVRTAVETSRPLIEAARTPPDDHPAAAAGVRGRRPGAAGAGLRQPAQQRRQVHRPRAGTSG